MSERCHDALECRPEDLRSALSIHTQKITDSCRDKDCIEDLRVYLTRESQAVLDTAAAAKVRSAELIYTAIDVSPLAFHRNHYTIDLTFYYKIIADAAVGPCRPAAICGLALFSKRAVLCGENTGAHIFRSDSPGNTGGSLPTAVVDAAATNSRCIPSPQLSTLKAGGFFVIKVAKTWRMKQNVQDETKDGFRLDCFRAWAVLACRGQKEKGSGDRYPRRKRGALRFL